MKRDQGDWADVILANSNLPMDEFTPTEGSNYGLPGFDFDTDYNEGVMESARLPEARGMAKLPDGIVTAEEVYDFIPPEGVVGAGEEGSDFTDMLAEGQWEYPADSEKVASLINHDWLDPTQKQDPERLPDSNYFAAPGEPNGSVGQLARLEKAWGEGRRTDGLRLLPNKDREIIDYEASLQEKVKSHLPGNKDTEDRFLKTAILRAMRQSTYGEPLREIQEEMLRSLGPQNADRAKSAMKVIAAEHGLAGKVFIRAAAFPGIRNGKWTKLIKKVAKTARYVIDDFESPIGTMLGMKVVQSVPWKQALKHYSPLLQSVGYRFASEGDPKEILRQAFRKGPVAQEHIPTAKPVVVAPADQVSFQEARRVFNASDAVSFELPDPKVRERAGLRKKALIQIAKWVKAGRLNQDDAFRLNQSKAEPLDLLRVASGLMAAAEVRQSSYQGIGERGRVADTDVSKASAWAQLRKAEETALKATKQIQIEARKKALVQIAKWAAQGLLTKKEASLLGKLDEHPNELVRIASGLIDANSRKPGGEVVDRIPNTSTAKYSGDGWGMKSLPPDATAKQVVAELARAEKEAHQNEARWTKAAKQQEQKKVHAYLGKLVKAGLLTPKDERRLQGVDPSEALKVAGALVDKNAKSPIREVVPAAQQVQHKYGGRKYEALQSERVERTQNPKEASRLVKWARLQMTEGLAGKDLNHMLESRFSNETLVSASSLLKKVRAEHEGLSGFLYADAEAYASKQGTEGCDEGGLRHRANGLKYVLAMERCGDCVFRNADDVCQKYNKPLVDELPVKNRTAYQKEMIRQSNATEAENIGTLFAPTFDPEEFNLTASTEEDIQFDETPSGERLGEIFFGGVEVPS